VICALGCGKSLDETKDQAALADWEQLTVTATRNGGSEHILSAMVCPTCAPEPGNVSIVLKTKAVASK